jgi:hypothetical protein
MINNVCCYDCCEIDAINSGLNELSLMIDKIKAFNNQWNNFVDLHAFKDYTETIQLFSKSDYDPAKSYFSMYSQTDNFFNQETSVISHFSQILSTVRQTK